MSALAQSGHSFPTTFRISTGLALLSPAALRTKKNLTATTNGGSQRFSRKNQGKIKAGWKVISSRWWHLTCKHDIDRHKQAFARGLNPENPA